jgi:hypothetical protein
MRKNQYEKKEKQEEGKKKGIKEKERKERKKKDRMAESRDSDLNGNSVKATGKVWVLKSPRTRIFYISRVTK